MIQLTVWRGTPICMRMRRIYVQLTLSNNFTRSSLRINALRFFVLIEWRDSWTTPIGSVICLFLRNPNCSCEIPLSRESLILTAMTLEINLYRRLHKEIGRNSAKVCGLSLFGIRAMKVEFRDKGIMPEIQVESTADKSSLASRSKKYK